MEKRRDGINFASRGVFTSVPELIGAIDEYIAHHNTKPKPFIWPKALATSCKRSFAPAAA